MESSCLVDTTNLAWFIVYIERLPTYIHVDYYFHILNIVLGNSAGPDEMLHYGLMAYCAKWSEPVPIERERIKYFAQGHSIN